ncbi:MAG TPA: lycopene beta-cyclase CrtY, partial [Kiritimatiellia bacterium]|nr:lycopene beta-cyclase CrtY [Kiritimatiellia bacterium]
MFDFTMFDPELHESYDVALLGGGLQNGLLLLFLLERQPGARVALVEAESRLGGCHTWSFHDSDVPKGVEGLLDPLVEHRWPSYRVMFPGLERELVGGYGSFSGESLDRVVQAKAKTAPGVKLCLGCRVERVEAGEVALEDGRRIRAGLIVDSRGPDAYGMAGRPAYQKFLGLEVGLKKPHGMRGPILMDARVGQEEGYRFVYVLPLDDRRLLVEDTYFSDTPDVCRETLRGRVLAYCADEGFEVGEVFKEEVGVLPLPCRDLELKAGTGCLRGGYGGGGVHPTAGYSFSCAGAFAGERGTRGGG